MLEIIKEIGAVVTALIVIAGALYTVYTTYHKNSEMVIQKHLQEKEYDKLKESVIDNHRNLIRLELLMLMTNKADVKIIWNLFDEYREIHGNSYIQNLVYKYCDNRDADKPLF
jgi:hypothetical protein